ncbi:hypothetical protein [Spectribacter hydrogenoxidans]|uniref:Uncharacterized protein n=1 Tax=Spectribacter hydrogenoxidans TaxID=3075608 RepID=A0ABU3BYT3_9GAMM|nr:hypothetical protein [Salinisphaera sp. W335]MDT0634478.1 hypothetical protein [Salinisphaera sp. W335]
MSNTKNFIVLTLYTLAYAAALLALAKTASAHRQQFFMEGHGLEGIHQGLLAAVVGLSVIGAILRPAWRSIFVVLALLGLLGSIRELNNFLSDALPILGWQGPAGLVLIALAGYTIGSRRRLGQELTTFLRSDALAMLWAGLVITALMAQQIGHGEFLQPLLGDDYQPVYKRVIEEVIEAFGYLMIALGTLQTVVRAPRNGEDADPV